ncbi:flavin-binding monooxygenase protein [Rutstroemia sp. NJR-2017a WRK4]|nr:flavin-binding monooxygenase protein [Rutstroemia sp. NJR-2017a WRK4]
MAAFPDTFTLEANPGTDIWRKPPTTNDFNAPTKTHSTLPRSDFLSARLTFSGPWVQQYDQGGLLLTLPSARNPTARWLKTGVELYNGVPYISTVGCDNYSDWSIWPLTKEEAEGEITIEVRREGEGLWVYWVKGEGKGEQPLREVTWLFAEEGEVVVGAYAARPGKEIDGGLRVKFRGLEVVEGKK